MTRNRTPRFGRVRPTRWLKALPFLLLPFTVLFAETLFYTLTIRNEYIENKEQQRINVLEDGIKVLRVKEAELLAMQHISMQADDLGLVEPSPSQVVVYHVKLKDGLFIDRLPQALARAERRITAPNAVGASVDQAEVLQIDAERPQRW